MSDIWKWITCQLSCKKFLTKNGYIKETALVFDGYSIKINYIVILNVPWVY